MTYITTKTPRVLPPKKPQTHTPIDRFDEDTLREAMRRDGAARVRFRMPHATSAQSEASRRAALARGSYAETTARQSSFAGRIRAAIAQNEPATIRDIAHRLGLEQTQASGERVRRALTAMENLRYPKIERAGMREHAIMWRLCK